MTIDINVQFFSHLNGLVLGNNWGDLIRVLDKALVTGIDFTQITAASIDEQGDVHITLYSTHNAMLLQVVELMGFAPSSLNQKYRIKGVPNATQLILKPKTDIAERSITTAGAGKLASLGYDIIFRDTGDVKRVYRAKNPTTQHPFIRVDETISDGTNTYNSNYAKSAMVGLLKSMEHIDDYENPNVLQLPMSRTNLKKNWALSGSGLSNNRGWSKWYWACSQGVPDGPFEMDTPSAGNRSFTLIGDNDAFYLLRSMINSDTNNKLLSGCGLFNSTQDAGVCPNWFLMATNKITNAGSTNTGFASIEGGTPLVFDPTKSNIMVTRYDTSNPVQDHLVATPVIPDLNTGYSNIYSGVLIGALEIPLTDTQKKLRGALKHVLYSGNSRGAVLSTTPIISDNSMFLTDGIWVNSGQGSIYFYLGEL